MNKGKYNIIIIGCQMNKSDSERMSAYLESIGYIYEVDPMIADLVVVTTCGVRQSAEDRAYGMIHNIKKNNSSARIILTGCLSDREDVRNRIKDQVDIWLNIKDLPSLESKLKGLTDNQIQRDCDYLKQNPNYISSFSAFIPIGNGCDNFCTYCVVPHARGREIYRESEEIIEEVDALVKRGYKEITLIAQNVNSYHEQSGDMDFSDLLQKVNDIDGDFWLRFSTSHPKDMSDKLIETMAKCEKLCEHLHLPAQSGDDEILIAMNRKYNVADYKILLKKVRAKMPDISISTDIIVGFPGETKNQFGNTIKLFEDSYFDMAYISKYSPRPGTAAEKLIDDVSRDEKRWREEELQKILNRTALENNQKYLNSKVTVLVERKNKKEKWYGKTRSFKNVKFSDDGNDLQGKMVNVYINKVDEKGLYGKYEN